MTRYGVTVAQHMYINMYIHMYPIHTWDGIHSSLMPHHYLPDGYRHRISRKQPEWQMSVIFVYSLLVHIQQMPVNGQGI